MDQVDQSKAAVVVVVFPVLAGVFPIEVDLPPVLVVDYSFIFNVFF
jgi:hypothetical protein